MTYSNAMQKGTRSVTREPGLKELIQPVKGHFPVNVALVTLSLSRKRGTALTSLYGRQHRPVPLRGPVMAFEEVARIVMWNGDGYRGCLQTLLHDPMAPALALSGESVLFENARNLRA